MHTLAINVGHVFELDARLWRAQVEARIQINSRRRPARTFRPEVLLAARGPGAKLAGGTAYFVVGVVRGARLVGARTLRFETLERFAVPVLVEPEEVVRDTALGEREGWGPAGFYYLPEHAMERLGAGAKDDISSKGVGIAVVPNVVAPAASPTSEMKDVGVHRVHLVCMEGEGAGDSVTAYMPLDADQRLAKAAPRPWLVKAIFAGNTWLGELVAEGGKWNRIDWHMDGEEDSLIDLGTVPVRLGAPVRLHLARSDQSDLRRMVVRHLQRV